MVTSRRTLASTVAASFLRAGPDDRTESSHRHRAGSEPRQSLRTVVRDRDAGHFLQRAIWLSGVPHQLRRIPIDLVEKGAIWRNPVIARAAADVSTKPSEGAIALDNRTC